MWSLNDIPPPLRPLSQIQYQLLKPQVLAEFDHKEKVLPACLQSEQQRRVSQRVRVTAPNEAQSDALAGQGIALVINSNRSSLHLLGAIHKPICNPYTLMQLN